MICPECGLPFINNECPKCGMLSSQSSKTDKTSSNLKLAGPLPENTEMGPKKRYIIKKELKSGGMGRPYIAIDKALNNKVCVIKEFDSDLGSLSERALESARKSFETEANILATLRHENMPSVWDYFIDYGRAYFTEDFIDGSNLEDLTKGLAQPLTEDQLIEVGISICKVLSYVHGQNPPIIHRDIKPQNIMCGVDGRYYLIDFGAARNYKPGHKDTIAFGTKGFAAPEAENEQTEIRSDIYSLGMTLFTLATCKTPDKYVVGSFPLSSSINSKISDQLSRIINKAIELLPRDRYDANEMEQALLALKNENKTCSWCGNNVVIEATTCSFCGGTAGELPGFAWEGIRGDRTYKGTRSYNIRLKGNAKWHVKGLGEIKATPLVTEGNLVLPISNGEALCCFDVSRGNQLWSINLARPAVKTGYIMGSYIYYPLSDGSIIKVSINEGKIVDTFSFGEDNTASMALAGSQGTLVIISRNKIINFDMVNRSVSWSFTHDQPIQTSATIVGNSIVVGDDIGCLVMLDHHGNIAWISKGKGDAITGAVAFDLGVLFYSTRSGYVGCVEQNGAVGWGISLLQPTVFAPCITRDLVITGGARNGLTAISKSTGTIRWQNSAINSVVSPPIACGDSVIAFDYKDGKAAIFRLEGNLIAEFEATPSVVFPTAIYKENIVVASTTGHIIVFE